MDCADKALALLSDSAVVWLQLYKKTAGHVSC